MPPRPLVLLGGGGHARVVIDAAAADPGTWRVTGFVDPEGAASAAGLAGIPHLGDDDPFLATLLSTPVDDRPWLIVAVGGLGDPALRRGIVDRYAQTGRWATVIHPSAVVADAVKVGEGTVILATAVVNAGARIGRHVVVNTAAVVEHDVRIGDLGQLAPGAVVGGGATIGAGAFVGLGALVRDHVRVGDGAVVGMGAVVTADVADGQVVVGSPARPREGSDE